MSDDQWLKNELARSGLSQDSLAGVLDIPAASVSRLMRGQRRLSASERSVAASLFALVPSGASPEFLAAVRALKTSRVRERVGGALLDEFVRQPVPGAGSQGPEVEILAVLAAAAEAIQRRETVLRADQILLAVQALDESLPDLIARSKPGKRQPPFPTPDQNWLVPATPFPREALAPSLTIGHLTAHDANTPRASASTTTSGDTSEPAATRAARSAQPGKPPPHPRERSFRGDGPVERISTTDFHGRGVAVFRLAFADPGRRFRPGDEIWAYEAPPRSLPRDAMVLITARRGDEGGGSAIVGRLVDQEEGAVRVDTRDEWIPLDNDDLQFLIVLRADFRN